MSAAWIDTHAHLDDDRFAADLPAVLARAADAGVGRVLTIGVDLATSRAAVGLARSHPTVSAVVGIQPNHAAEAGPGDWDEIVRLAGAGPPVVAVGETGLDRYWDRCPFPAQQDYFARHLDLARRLSLPVVIHCREAEADVVAMLKHAFETHGPVRGVMHSFSGDADTARACVAMGLHVSFAGMVTYKTGSALLAVTKEIPADRVLVETDSPYLAPVPVRGKRNEPASVVHTAAAVASARGEPLAEFAARTTANARTLFGLPFPGN
jgi:TatD DNase family protein